MLGDGAPNGHCRLFGSRLTQCGPIVEYFEQHQELLRLANAVLGARRVAELYKERGLTIACPENDFHPVKDQKFLPKTKNVYDDEVGDDRGELHGCALD
jgi:hypothetical protein